jgi:hypothetical protein
MSLNPYASFLGGQDPLQVIAATSARLSALAEKLGPAGLERALAPGKWSARKILCHLADTEVALAFRLRQAAAEPHHVIQPFDQDKWAAAYDTYDARAALEVFLPLRRWNLTLIRSLPPAVFAKPLTHPERGAMTFQTMIETIAGHDLNHLRQIETIASTVT